MDRRYDRLVKTLRGNGEVRKNGTLLAKVRYNVTLGQDGIIVAKNGQDLPGRHYAVGTVTVSNNEDLVGEDGLTLHLEGGGSFAFSAKSSDEADTTFQIASIGALKNLT